MRARQRALLLAMLLIAAVWLSYEFWRLLFQPEPMGAIDLKQRWTEINAWFRGNVVYGAIPTAVYPPASYLLLWPIVGWMTLESARWVWAITSVLGLYGLTRIIRWELRPHTRTERWFLTLLPLTLYATGATIGNGQLLVHLLPVLLASILTLRKPPSLSRDLIVAGLFTVALIKPSATAPFFWIILFASRSILVPALVVLSYSAVTWLAAYYQDASVLQLCIQWFQRGQAGVDWGTRAGAYANLGDWLLYLGLEQYTTAASLVVLSITGLWVAIHRKIDLWLLAATVAMFARFWTYHFWYDDLLLLIPLIALYREYTRPVARHLSRITPVLFLATLFTLLAPGGLYLFPSPLRQAYVAMQVVTWLSGFAYLLVLAWGDRRKRDNHA